uniref:Probable pectate lyase F n=1 Tax=Meloidogyne enterolobii TaxID=390850 RepID=A0A6V7WC29_MELEN|nr:unnamed protein product [Meloidogyne enterolobii]
MLPKYFINIFIIFYIIASLIKKCEADNFCKFPPATKTVQQSTTIPVSGTKDFGYVRLVATSALRSACTIPGSVNGKNIIEVEDGGHVKNVIIGDAARGIWCKGGCTLENVFFEKICYHGADLGNSADPTPKTYNIIGGGARNAPDKIFTQAGAGQTTITGFCAEGFGKCWRSCGMDCVQHQRSIKMTNCKFHGPGLSVISLNTNLGDKMSISNVFVDNSISFLCQEYRGIRGITSEMHPTSECKPNENCAKTSCNFSPKAIKLI